MLKDIIIRHYSCRKYFKKTIDNELVYRCIDIDRLALLACNLQPWLFYIVLDIKKRNGKINSIVY